MHKRDLYKGVKEAPFALIHTHSFLFLTHISRHNPRPNIRSASCPPFYAPRWHIVLRSEPKLTRSASAWAFQLPLGHIDLRCVFRVGAKRPVVDCRAACFRARQCYFAIHYPTRNSRSVSYAIPRHSMAHCHALRGNFAARSVTMPLQGHSETHRRAP